MIWFIWKACIRILFETKEWLMMVVFMSGFLFVWSVQNWGEDLGIWKDESENYINSMIVSIPIIVYFIIGANDKRFEQISTNSVLWSNSFYQDDKINIIFLIVLYKLKISKSYYIIQIATYCYFFGQSTGASTIHSYSSTTTF